MSLKIFKALWFLSVLAVLAILLFTYSTLPQTVILEDNGPTPMVMSRDGFFYFMTAFITIVNVMVYFVSKVFKSNVNFRAWFHGLVIALNIFFIVAMNFIGLFNSGERFDYKRIDFIIYGSIGLFLLWIVAWPCYVFYKKMFIKQST